MSDLSDKSTQELTDELSRRGDMPRCRCQRWQTYIGAYDSDGKTLRCSGCRRAVAKCWCR